MKQNLIFLPVIFIVAGYVVWYMTGVNSLETVYAPGYTEYSWRTVKPGVSISDVRRVVGVEIDTYKDNQNTVVCFAGHKSAGTIVRYVVCNNDGIVVDVVSDVHQLD